MMHAAIVEAVVPEPATSTMLAVAAAGAMWFSRSRTWLRAGLLACVAVGFTSRSASCQPLPPTYNELVYATIQTPGADRDLHLDLWVPEAATHASPLVIWIHGGGWQSGTHNNPPAGLRPLLDRGFAVASVEYRLSGEAIAPAPIHDVKGAVRFLRASADQYGLDPDHFAAWGSSAGGHLTALLATSGGVPEAEGDIGGNPNVSSAIQAAVDFYGPTDLLLMDQDVRTPPGSSITHDDPNSPESRLIGFDGPDEGIGVLRDNLFNPTAPFPEKAALVQLMSPLTHVTSDDPAMFIAHGDLDTAVPFLQSVRLRDALSLAGVENEFRRVVGEGHGGPLFQPVALEAVDFLAARLIAVPEPSSMAMIVALIACAAGSRPARH